MANFDSAKSVFRQADTNQDGSVDREEFRNWLSNGSAVQTSSSFESTGNIVNSSNILDQAGLSGYDGSTRGVYGSSSGFNTSYATATIGATSEQSTGAAIQTESVQQTNEYISRSGTSLFHDPNPQIVRRATTEGPVTYQQKILVRFLQPPPVPPPGPLIIKEVRPPQPPPPPPLVIRQRAPPLPTPPPLILRERPPPPPTVAASQTVIRRLPALPIPPRSVIIERLPALPPRPRDIIIERWIPYGAHAKRRTIVQRAEAAVRYPAPRNIIVVYDAVRARVIRQFQRLGVTQQNPEAYVARYGVTLLDSATLVQQARTAGVVEDISPPAAASTSSSATQVHSTSSFFSNTSANSDNGVEVNTFGLDTAANANTNYTSSTAVLGESAFASTAGVSSSGFDVVGASFNAADTNRDGRLNRAEFQQFVQGGL